MSGSEIKRWVTREPLVFALVASVLLHVILFFFVQLAITLGWIAANVMPALLVPPASLATTPAQQKLPEINAAKLTLPQLLLEVDPATATKEASKDAKFLAPMTTAASSPDISVDAPKPKIDGKQEKYLKPTPTSRDKTGPTAVPMPAPQPETQRTEAPAKPQQASKPGDMAKAKPADAPTIGDDLSKRAGEPKPESHTRPRTLAEAARMNPALAGQQSKQDGGAKRRGRIGFDAKQSELGEYFREFVRIVQNNWYSFIEQRGNLAATQTGEVVVTFRLYEDGTIRATKIESTTVDLIMSHICQRAIDDIRQYTPWPSDMKRLFGSTSHEFRFTFYYE